MMIRGLKSFNPSGLRFFSTSHVTRLFNLQLEHDIRSKIQSLPKLDNIYVNPDGSSRKPDDKELQTIAQLNTLSAQRSLSLKDFFTLSNENETLYKDNDDDLKKFKFSSNKIIDKIPFEDSKTGEIQWKVVRANEKEGWENVSYYVYVPLMILLVSVLIFKNDETIETWADKELMLRLKENGKDDESLLDALDRLVPELEVKLSRKELNERDAVIIERILSGQYDNLMGLKIKQQNLPALQKEESE